MHPVAELFHEMPKPGHGLHWLAQQLLELAAERFVLILEGVPTPSGDRELYTIGTEPIRVDLPRFSLFRSLLAQFPTLANSNLAEPLNPYSDRFRITLQPVAEPIHLEVDLVNTPSLQRLQIVRMPAHTSSTFSSEAEAQIA